MFGLGSRNPQMRYLRIGLLAVLLIAGTAFHHTGAGYTAIRSVYYVVILGGLGYVLWRRSASRHENPTAHDPPGPDGPGPGWPHREHAPGWYPDRQDMSIQRYWDGTTWTTTRHWDGTTWVEGGSKP